MSKRKNWQPTQKQRRALRYAREHAWDYQVTEMATEIGIARRTYYKWFETAGFRDWWQREWERFFAIRMGRLWGRVFAAACGEERKPFQAYAKLLIERFDRGWEPRSSREQPDAPEERLKTYVNVNVEKVAGKADDDDVS